jgi:DNA-binding MarR family transcriptional regulator
MTKRSVAKHGPTPPETQEALEDYVPYLVNRLASLGQATQNKKLGSSGISTVTLRTLSILHIHKALTVNEVAARAFAEQSTASRAIDGMVSAGLVERQISIKDQRRREIALTNAGRALLYACWPLMEDHYDRLSDGISAEDIDTCRQVLSRMIENLKRPES